MAGVEGMVNHISSRRWPRPQFLGNPSKLFAWTMDNDMVVALRGAQHSLAIAWLSFVSLRWLPKETFDLSYSVKYLWGSGDLLEQAFCKPYCEVLRDIANNLTGGKLSVLLRALSLSFPSAKNKHCSHWMMKSVQPLFIWLFCVKDKEALVLKMGVKRARKEVKKAW